MMEEERQRHERELREEELMLQVSLLSEETAYRLPDTFFICCRRSWCPDLSGSIPLCYVYLHIQAHGHRWCPVYIYFYHTFSVLDAFVVLLCCNKDWETADKLYSWVLRDYINFLGLLNSMLMHSQISGEQKSVNYLVHAEFKKKG